VQQSLLTANKLAVSLAGYLDVLTKNIQSSSSTPSHQNRSLPKSPATAHFNSPATPLFKSPNFAHYSGHSPSSQFNFSNFNLNSPNDSRDNSSLLSTPKRSSAHKKFSPVNFPRYSRSPLANSSSASYVEPSASFLPPEPETPDFEFLSGDDSDSDAHLPFKRRKSNGKYQEGLDYSRQLKGELFL
jgi:hypothetical protein